MQAVADANPFLQTSKGMGHHHAGEEDAEEDPGRNTVLLVFLNLHNYWNKNVPTSLHNIVGALFCLLYIVAG